MVELGTILSNSEPWFKLPPNFPSRVADPDFRPLCGKAQAKYFLQGLRQTCITLHWSFVEALILAVFDHLQCTRAIH